MNKSPIREASIETYLRQRVRAMGGRAYKFVSPGTRGVPERLVALPGGKLAFVELKAHGQKSRPTQELQQGRLRTLGCRVYADVDSREKVDALLQEMGDIR